MQRTQAFAFVIAASVSFFGVSGAWATDAPSTPSAQEAAAVPASGSDAPAAAQEATSVVKTKTKSNQSNDRAAAQASTDEETPATDAPAEVLKTKTKSNQSND
jgi:hypothetical protein